MYVARSYEGTKVYHLRYIVDFRSALWLPYDPVGCKYRHALRAKQTGSRVCFFRMAPSLDGERARQLANTLLGAKDGGRNHQERIGVDELALSDTMLRLSYDNTTVLRVNRPSTRR